MPDLAEPSYETTLYYSEPLLRRVVFSFWKRTVAIGFPLALLVVAICAVLWASSHGINWLVGATAMVIVLRVLTAPAVFVVHYRNTLGRFRQMGEPPCSASRGRHLVCRQLRSRYIHHRRSAEFRSCGDFPCSGFPRRLARTDHSSGPHPCATSPWRNCPGKVDLGA